MTEQLTIGRVVIPEPPARMDFAGDVLSVSGDLIGDSWAHLSALRFQLLGLVDNPDEDVYPVTFTEDPDVDGFWTVESVNVGSTPTMLETWSVPWSATLRRVRQPMFETLSSVVLRTNAHSITGTPDCIVGVYPFATAFEVQSTGATNVTVLYRTTPTGTIGLATTTSASSYPTSGTLSWSARPVDHYMGRPFLEVRGEDDVWRPIPGRFTPEGAAGNWRLNNGIIRVGPSATTSGHLTVGIYTGSGWESTDFYVGYYSGSWATNGKVAYSTYYAGNGDIAPTVLRNSLDEVSIRFKSPPFAKTGTSAGGVIDLTLQAGAALFSIGGSALDSQKWGVAVSTAAGATAITGGLRLTSNDAVGNRWVILSAPASTNDTTNGIRYLTSAATSFTFGVGISLNGSSALTGDAETDLADQFYGAAVMSTRAVAK